MTEMVHGPATIRVRDNEISNWWRTLDKWTVSAVFMLFATGLLLGLAASPPLAARNGLEPFHYVGRQAVFGGLAMAVMLVVSALPLVSLRRIAIVGFAGTLAALLLLPFLGTDFGKGAMRWYSLGFASVQPSEFMKPCFVIVAAWLMAAGQEIEGPPGKALSFIVAVTLASILILQPDFGQAVLVLFSWGVMYFVAGAPVALLMIIMGASVLGGFVAYNSSEHFARRIDGYLAVDVDPTTQLGYAANAIREGGFFGVGVGEGTVKWSLPDAHTDFIIAVAAEEYGVFFVLAIIAAYALIVVRSFFRLTVERNPFVRYAGVGLVAIFGAQAMINMGVAVRLLPAKGMTLPFVSYGGSSVVAGGILMGLLLALTRTRPQGVMRDMFARGTR